MFATADAGPVGVTRRSGWFGLGAFTVFLLIGVLTRLPSPIAWIGGLVALTAAVPLFLARPRFVFGYAIAAGAGVVAVNGHSGAIGWFALCVLASWCVLAGGVWVGVAYGMLSLLVFGWGWLHDHDSGWGAWTAGMTFSILGTFLARRQLVLVERLNAAQADLAERTRAEERDRIAHELHDVIAHSLTVSLLHVASARLSVENDDPADAARALAEAERLGRQALTEVRATMGLARSRDETAIAAPTPGINELPALIAQLNRAGVDVSLVADGELDRLPATTGSTIYRIVQESLTNVARHAPGAEAAVRLRTEPGSVEVVVDSDGPPGRGSGQGLSSMSARAEAVGGACTAGPGGRGWLVRATLPVELS